MASRWRKHTHTLIHTHITCEHINNYTWKQISLTHKDYKRSLQMHTCSNSYSYTYSLWKNLAYYPYCITVVTFLLSTVPPPWCVRGECERRSNWLLHTTAWVCQYFPTVTNKTPLVFSLLIGRVYSLPTDRQRVCERERLHTRSHLRWFKNISSLIWTWLQELIQIIASIWPSLQSAGKFWQHALPKSHLFWLSQPQKWKSLKLHLKAAYVNHYLGI